jgi:hypothetical protein
VGDIAVENAELGVKPAPVVADFSSRGPNTITPQILKVGTFLHHHDLRIIPAPIDL